MQRFKNFFIKVYNFLIKPPVFFITLSLVLAVIFIGLALTCVFMEYSGVFSYVFYALAGVYLAYSVFLIVKWAPKLKNFFKSLIKKSKLLSKLALNFGFRTSFFAVVSIILNLAFVAFNVVFAILIKSVWYGASAIYYLALSLLKFYVIFAENAVKEKEVSKEEKLLKRLKNYRLCGISLFVLCLAMCGVVTLMILQKNTAKYGEIMAIVFASFTFYKITFAIINAIKAKKENDYQIQAIKNIGLAEVAVTLVSLQMALVTTFGEGDTLLPLNAITGFTACALTIFLGIYMIVSASKKIKTIKK